MFVLVSRVLSTYLSIGSDETVGGDKKSRTLALTYLLDMSIDFLLETKCTPNRNIHHILFFTLRRHDTFVMSPTEIRVGILFYESYGSRSPSRGLDSDTHSSTQ